MGAEGAALGLLGTWGLGDFDQAVSNRGGSKKTCHNLYMNLSFASLSTALDRSQDGKLC